MSSLGEAVLTLRTNDRDLSRGLSQAERSSRRAFGTIGTQAAGMSTKVGGSFKAMGAAALATGGVLAGAFVTTKIVGAIGGAVNAAANFERTMSVLGTVSGATDAQLRQIQRTAIALGNDITLPGTSAKDAGEAMLELSKAGLSVKDTMDASKGVLQLSAAAQIENARAAEITANALNSFGLKGRDAIFVSDQLAATANASSVEITDVADALAMSSAVFASFQGPVVGSKNAMTDLNTAIGILGNVGIKGSDAGTSLKQMLLQLAGPSQTAKDKMKSLYLATLGNVDAMDLNAVAMGNAAERGTALKNMSKELGVSMSGTGDIAYDASGKMRPLNEIVGLVAKATKNMSDEQRNAYLTQVFGADATRAIIGLMKAQGGEWDNMRKKVTEQGAAGKVANAQMQGLKGAFEGLKSAVETLALVAGMPLLKPITAAVRGLATLVSNNSDAIGRFAELVASGLTRAGIAAMDLARAVWNASGPIRDQLMQLANVARWAFDIFRVQGIGGLVSALPALGGQVSRALGTIVGTLRGWAMQAISAFTGWIVDVGPRILSGLKYMVFRYGPGLAKTLLPLVGAFTLWVGVAMPALVAAGSAALAALGGWVATAGVAMLAVKMATLAPVLWRWVKPQIPVVLDKLGDLITRAGMWLREVAVPSMRTALGQVGQLFSTFIAPNIIPMLTQLGRLVGRAGDWLVYRGLPLLQETLAKWGDALTDWIEPRIMPALRALGRFEARVGRWILDIALPAIRAKLTEWGGALVDWIRPQIRPALARMEELRDRFLVWMGNVALPALQRAVSKWGAAFVDWVGPRILPLLDNLFTLLGRVVRWTAQVGGPKLVEQLTDWGFKLISWVVPRIPGLLASLGEFLGRALVWTRDVAGKAFREQAAKWATSFVAWVTNADGRMPGVLRPFIDRVVAWARDTALPAIKKQMVTWANTALDWIRETVLPNIVARANELKDKLTNWARDTALPAIKKQMVTWANAAVDWVTDDALPKIGEKLSEFWNFIKFKLTGPGGMLDKIKDAGVGIGKGLINGIIGQLNNGLSGVENFINRFGNAIDSVASKLGLGDLIPTVSIPTIPTYAKGTRNHPGGMAIVGEQGPELVRLPRGAQVMTAAQTERMIGRLKGGGPQVDTVELGGKPWPGGVIPYAPFDHLARRRDIQQAMGLLESRSPVRFRKIVAGQFDNNYLVFKAGAGNSSYMGMAGMKQQPVTLAQTPDAGAAMHEIGHAIGLGHEQQRFDRDKYIRILWENIDPAGRGQYEKVWRDPGSSYDLNSMMHYWDTAFSKNGLPVMEAYNGQRVGRLLDAPLSTQLRASDVASIRAIYPTNVGAIDHDRTHDKITPPTPPRNILTRGIEAMVKLAMRGINLPLPGVLAEMGPAIVGKLVSGAIAKLTSSGPDGPGPAGGLPLRGLTGKNLYDPGSATFYGGAHRGWDLRSSSGDNRVFAPRPGHWDPFNAQGHSNIGGWLESAGGVRDMLHHLVGTRGAGTVKAGDVLGRYEQIGTSNIPHLHWERLINGVLQSSAAAYGLNHNAVALANGGIVRKRRGGTLAVLGEGRHDEAVIPLDKRRGVAEKHYNLTYNSNRREGELSVRQVLRDMDLIAQMAGA